MDCKNCKVIDGTHYQKETPDAVVYILERARKEGTRLLIHYGKDGRAWGDQVLCTVGRSTGTCKIPLAIKTLRSLGGVGILDHCIVKIENSRKRDRLRPLFNSLTA
jgi:hypothetical protein